MNEPNKIYDVGIDPASNFDKHYAINERAVYYFRRIAIGIAKVEFVALPGGHSAYAEKGVRRIWLNVVPNQTATIGRLVSRNNVFHVLGEVEQATFENIIYAFEWLLAQH